MYCSSVRALCAQIIYLYVNSMPAESAAAVLERVDASGCCVRGGLDSIVSVDRYSLRLYFKGVDNGDDSGQSVAHVDAHYVVNASDLLLLLILSVQPSACTSVVVVQTHYIINVLMYTIFI
jgi:hypothetical protein